MNIQETWTDSDWTKFSEWLNGMLRLGHTKAQSMITYQSTKAALRSLTFKLTNGDCSSTGRWLTGDVQVTASE
jgi:hypothetical protein